MNVILCSDKKVQVPRYCPAAIAEGGTQLAFRLLRLPVKREPVGCTRSKQPLPWGGWGRDGGEGHHNYLKAWVQQWAALARALELVGHSPQPVPQAPRSPTGPRPGELESPREKARLHLLPHSQSEDHHSTGHWLNAQTNGPSLTVIACGRGHCRAAQRLNRTTNGPSLTVIACGKGHCRADQWLSRITNGPSLTVIACGRGHCRAAQRLSRTTNGPSLTVIACGRGHCRADQ